MNGGRGGPAARPPLGVMALPGEAVRAYRAVFLPASLAYLVPLLVSGLLAALLFGFDSISMVPEVQPPLLSVTLAVLLQTAGSCLGVLAVTIIVAENHVGRPIDIVSGWRRALPFLPAVLLMSLFVGLSIGLGLLLLVLPGLWLTAAFAVFIPATVFEGAGLKGASRSLVLTKGYRWPIAGLILVTILPLIVITVAAGFFGIPLWSVSPIAGFLIETLAAMVPAAFFSIVGVLLYWRLCEIEATVERA
ncbi:MAG: hypothetical protein AAF371_15900 [Pseudomonadota bacterium]